MSQPLLEASEGVREAEGELRLLRLANRKLEDELREAKDALRDAKAESAGALKAQAKLRALLTPLYGALRAIFGELAELVDDGAAATVATADSGIWQQRIAKATGTESRVLQVLLDGGGPMTLQQVRMASGYGGNTSSYLNRLIAKNWVQKTGHGSYALKGA